MLQHRLPGTSVPSSVCRTPQLFLITLKSQLKYKSVIFWKGIIILFRLHTYTDTQSILILVYKLKNMQGVYFRSREFSRPRITPHKELISWPTSLCFVKGAYFTFPQLYYLPFYFPVAIPTIDDNLSRHLLWMPPRHFSLCLYFNLRLELHLNPSSAYNLIA